MTVEFVAASTKYEKRACQMTQQMGNLTDAKSLTGRASRQHLEKVKKERFSDKFASVVCEVVVFIRMTLVFHVLCVGNGSRRHGLMVRVLLCLLSASGTVNATADPSTHFSVAAAVVSATPAAAALAQPDVALRDGEASLLYGRAKVGKTPPEALGTSGGHIYEYQRRVCTSMFISRVVAFCTRPWRMKLLLFSLFAALGIPFAPTFC
ncbi:hypothetical protein ECC02_002722 [Trypanosoma cruzi]|uniref:Uncharacterized protein n=1 Tax=Trypanosoma cruzi TaxID=5693 RepID=A0A7J6YCK1_TRYCR|nr:hypothetical protein ECC02_002722 [Trypanosoma cruzi]